MAGAPPIVRWVVVATAAIWVAMELRQSISRRPEGVRANLGGELLFRLIVGAGAFLATGLARVEPSAAIRPGAVGAGVGLVLFWAGISLRYWSFRTLGRYFTFTVQTSADQPVITTGPYRLIRHPGYAGLLLIVMAFGLLIGNWWSLGCLAVAVLCGLVFRIRVEERALMRDLSGGYRAYAATRKRLVPFVW
ncbi:MAG: methyltransferase family protein [Candidatus Dormibacteria bacterium]